MKSIKYIKLYNYAIDSPGGLSVGVPVCLFVWVSLTFNIM